MDKRKKMSKKLSPEVEKIISLIASQIASEYQMGGLAGTIYEEFAHDILVRFLELTGLIYILPK